VINRNSCAVITPVYKSFTDLTNEELVNLKSSCKHLNSHPHVLFGPDTINWQEYIELYKSWGIAFDIKQFDSKYFIDLAGYNQLLKTFQFYEQFKAYQYILIVQTDAYVFKDELAYWCSKRYDYIGAPWFKESGLNKVGNEISGVGNGGFSLRNVQSTIRLLKRINTLSAIRNFWFKSHLQSLVRFEILISFFRNYFKIKDSKRINDILKAPYLNEDYYLSQTLANIFSDYKVASVVDAVKFSFEVNPVFLYKMNNGQLPFGCHAWEKHDPQFWKSIILKD